MALSNSSVWEVRPGVGSDIYGGGFVPGSGGTDFSQQNSPNSSGNNISTTDAVTSGTTLTSATASFTSAIVGNIIYLMSGGLTTGWYQVTAFGSTTSVTLDRSPGSGAGATMTIGGALATISQAYANSTLNNTIYVKNSGTYAVTTTLTLTGNNFAPMSFIGYNLTRGDAGRVTWTTATNSIPLIEFGAAGSNFVIQNFTFTTTAGTRATGIDSGNTAQSSGLRISNCLFNGFTTGIAMGYSSGTRWNMSALFVDGCEVKNCSSDGITCSPGSLFLNCYSHNNSGNGLTGFHVGSGTTIGGAITIERSAFWSNSGAGIFNNYASLGTASMSFLQIFSTAVGSNGGNGVRIEASTGALQYQFFVMVNCVLESNNFEAVYNDTSFAYALPLFLNNAYWNNGFGAYGGWNFGSQPTDVYPGAEVFTNPTGGDFTLNSTSNGGALLMGTGYPASLP